VSAARMPSGSVKGLPMRRIATRRDFDCELRAVPGELFTVIAPRVREQSTEQWRVRARPPSGGCGPCLPVEALEDFGLFFMRKAGPLSRTFRETRPAADSKVSVMLAGAELTLPRYREEYRVRGEWRVSTVARIGCCGITLLKVDHDATRLSSSSRPLHAPAVKYR